MRPNLKSASASVSRFYELVWPCRADILRMARLLTGGNDAEADDLAQETLLKAFAAIDSFRHGTDARAWLMRILRNTRIDRLRAHAKEAANVSLDANELEIAQAPQPQQLDADQIWQDPQQVLGAFSDQQIIDALKELPEEIRLTLLLVDVEQMDHSEAARILDVPVGTIKSRTHRGRAMLREVLLPVAKQMRLAR